MARTVAIIGAGQIGVAAAYAFFGAGWDITIHSRTRPQWQEFAREWREYVAGSDPAPVADVVLDTIAFDAEDMERYDPGEVGRLVVISSASVYCDDMGRTLDEGPLKGYPEFEGKITEAQATVAPGPESYSTRKRRMENRALDLFGDRATILRPCAIYGKWSRHPREWWFVKRVLDGRGRIPLIFNGSSRFQTTDVEQIAWTAVEAARRDVGGVFNVADTDSPSVIEIGRAIADFLEREVDFISVEGTGADRSHAVVDPRNLRGGRLEGIASRRTTAFPLCGPLRPGSRLAGQPQPRRLACRLPAACRLSVGSVRLRSRRPLSRVALTR
ncbi:hypothetical protein [Qipengyuania sp. ASV99]|uniref:hypothetical protein n=1 Tax=Qipengyuania sp. ASV99 TaxID=3399681 RepID=UPI003A4C7952